MSILDRNKIFFGLLHYVFSEQQNVDWAFKTSLANFIGINERLDNKKYNRDSVSDDIIEYVKHIKPYHLQFEQYIEKYTSQLDTANIKSQDILNAEIEITFDNIASKPSIEDTIYTISTSHPSISQAGLKYLNRSDNCIYISVYKDLEYIWEFNNKASNGIYYVSSSNTYYKKTIDDIIFLSNAEIEKFANESLANRIFVYKTKDLNLIEDYLNTHFKGITVNGDEFNLDNYGYDNLPYDKKSYEEPIISNTYYLWNDKIKKVHSNTRNITLNTPLVDKTLITNLTLNEHLVSDFSLSNGVITFNEHLVHGDRIVVKYEDVTEYFGVTNFEESETDKEKNIFLSIKENEDIIVNIPNTGFIPNKFTICGIKANGYTSEIKDFIQNKNEITIPYSSIEAYKSNLNPNDDLFLVQIIVTSVDYSLIYDKIYTWDNIYGIGNKETKWDDYINNNKFIQNLNGNNFLRPDYEGNRPSELSVLYPITRLTMYFNEDENKPSLKYFDFSWKNNQSIVNIDKYATLIDDVKMDSTNIILSNDIGTSIIKDESDTIIPGKIIIDSEIIYYHESKINEDGTVTLSHINRGRDGSMCHNKLLLGTFVYPYIESNSYNMNLMSSHYFVSDKSNNEYIINGEFSSTNSINVYKTSNIKLLSDIKFSSKSFKVSDNSFILPLYINNKLIRKGHLFINNDKLEFNKIEQNNDNTYTISGFNINKEYKKSSSIILSNKYSLVNPSDYTIKSTKYSNDEDGTYSKLKKYIVFKKLPQYGECIVIENQ